MKCVRTILAAAVLLVVGSIWAGPTDGPTPKKIQVPPSKESGKPGEAEVFKEFRGGQRACVIVVGDHRPVTELEILVYETRGDGGTDRLVGQDAGTKDLIGVVWYPARTANYRIVIRNPATWSKENPYNDCYVVFK